MPRTDVMIEQHYGFTAAPFRLSPDPRFFYRSREHGKAMAYLRYGLQQGEGFIIITGEVGAGKSTLVQQLLRELDRDRIVAGSIVTTNIEADDAIRLILTAFDLQPPSPDKAAALHCFEQFLRTQHRSGRRVLLVVDEAQNLPKRTIEELRMLSNFQIDQTPPLQIFLVGQPQFQDVLADPDLEQLRQRVIASQHLGPISLEDTRAYIEHRLRTVGWTGTPSFTDGAMQRIRDETEGVPRRINTLCARILLFGALENVSTFDTAEVDEVIADLHAEVAQRPRPRGGMRAPTATDMPGQSAGHYQASPAMSAEMTELKDRLRGIERSLETLENRITAQDSRLDEIADRAADPDQTSALQQQVNSLTAASEAQRSEMARQREVISGIVRIIARMLETDPAHLGVPRDEVPADSDEGNTNTGRGRRAAP